MKLFFSLAVIHIPKQPDNLAEWMAQQSSEAALVDESSRMRDELNDDISPDELAKEIEEIGSDLGIDLLMMREHVIAVREIFGPPTNRHLATFLRNHLTPGAKSIQAGTPVRDGTGELIGHALTQADADAAVDILPLRSTGLTKHGNPIALPDGPYRIPEDRDLTDDELDAMLVEHAIGVPYPIDEIRDYAKALKEAGHTRPSNREILDRTEHVFATP